MLISELKLPYSRHKKSTFKLPSFARTIDSTAMSLLLAFNTGEKKQIQKNILKKYKTLQLHHLFVPSGIHFSSVMISLLPFLFFIKRFNYYLFLLIKTALSLSPFLLDGFFSLKRIGLFKTALSIIRIDPFIVFLMTFFVDFLFGTYQYSHVSFIYSFLFLGIIMSSNKSNIHWLPFNLLGGQIIIASLTFKSLTIAGFLFSFILTSIFSFLFPVFFFCFWLGKIYFFSPVLSLVNFYDQFVLLCANISLFIGSYQPSLWLLLPIIILNFSIFKSKKILIFILIFLHSSPILNLPRTSFIQGKSMHTFMPREEHINIDYIKRTRRGYKVVYDNGRRCLVKIYIHSYSRSCKFIKSKSYL